MSFTLDHLLNEPASGRARTLQSLIRHLLESNPSRARDTDLASEKYSTGTANGCAPDEALCPGAQGFPSPPRQDREDMLEDFVVRLFHRICDNGKKTVLIQHAAGDRILNFCGPDIVETLRNAGFNCWIVDHPYLHDRCLPLDKALLEKMNFVSLVLVGPFGLSLDHNRDTRTFKLPFHASGPPEIERSILLHDYFYVPNHRTTDRIFQRYRQSAPLPRDQARHRRRFTAIPVGNLKNSRIRKARLAIRPEDRTIILFCAEAYDYANSVTEKYGAALMRGILERYPENTLVFRPHPVDVGHPVTLKILDTFSGEPRFIFDASRSSEDIMASGCTLITDGSVSGLTYCMASSRPAVFFNPFSFSGHFEPGVLGFSFEHGKLFRFASTIDEALEAMEDLVSGPTKEFDEITELADKAYAHPDDGMEYLLSCVHVMVEGKSLPDWKTLEIAEDELGNGSTADYTGLIRNSLLNIFQSSSLLKQNLSSLDAEDDTTDMLANMFFHVRSTHLNSFRENFSALLSGMRAYGCSRAAIRMIDSLLGPIVVRGDRDEAARALDMLKTLYRNLLLDVREGRADGRLPEIFRLSAAGTIVSRERNTDGVTDQELEELRSLMAELWLCPRVPRGSFTILSAQANGFCELYLSCRKCKAQRSLQVQFWYSDNVSCESCGTLNHLDPFEQALHLQEAFFEQLPAEGTTALWGAGGFYYKLMQKYSRLSGNRFLLVDADETLQGLTICTKKVHPPDVILAEGIQTVIITAMSRKDELFATLVNSYPSAKRILVPDIKVTPEGIVPVLNLIEGRETL